MIPTPPTSSPAELDVRTGSGIRLHVRLNGPQDGPPVILLHGFPEFWRGWAQVGDRLAQAGFRVIIPDQRGYNLSDKPTGVAAYAINTLSADVLALADALGIERFCLAGHDWGAAVAWQTAIHCPQRVQKLAILNVPHPDVMVRTLRSNYDQLLKSWYIFFFQIPALPEMLLRANDYAGLKRMLLSSGKHAPNQTPTFTAQDLQAYRDAWAQPGALTAMINWYRAAFRAGARTRPGVRRVSVPTLMLWGMNDLALSAGMAQPSIDLCDQGQLVTFENATHWVQHDEAPAVAGALMEFFAQS